MFFLIFKPQKICRFPPIFWTIPTDWKQRKPCQLVEAQPRKPPDLLRGKLYRKKGWKHTLTSVDRNFSQKNKKNRRHPSFFASLMSTILLRLAIPDEVPFENCRQMLMQVYVTLDTRFFHPLQAPPAASRNFSNDRMLQSLGWLSYWAAARC